MSSMSIRGLARSFGTAIVVCAGMTQVAAAEDWYVIVGSFRETSGNAIESADRLREAVDENCGHDIQWDYSTKFYNFEPGFLVVFSGPYASRNRAGSVLDDVRQCASDAYVKSSRYAGE